MSWLSWGSLIKAVRKDGKALQKPEIRPGHCTVASQMHCRPRKTGRSTARSRRRCIAGRGKLAGALHGRAGSAVQKPEIKQAQCKKNRPEQL